ncbi:MAG: hypothetical protein NTV49_05665, partial [Kiritimatiellaeota bacterium]|nr:hypothetical protein [Kiritimatiellota bacterium]
MLMAVIALCALTAVSGLAATNSFKNGAVEWNNVASWVGGIPTSNDVAYFNTTAAFAANMKENQSVLGLLFSQSGSVTHNDDGIYALTLGASGITVTTGAVSLGSTTTKGRVQITLNGAQAWTNNSASAL